MLFSDWCRAAKYVVTPHPWHILEEVKWATFCPKYCTVQPQYTGGQNWSIKREHRTNHVEATKKN